MRYRALGILALCAPLLSAAAQNDPHWRSLDVSRQLRDTAAQRIKVQYDAGRVDVRPTDAALLFGMHLRYDELRASPLHRHDAEQRTTVLGLESRGNVFPASSSRHEDSGELRLVLPRTIPLDLDMEFGGAQAALELGGLALQSARLEFGAAEGTLAFSTPNRSHMRELEISIGAADFTARGLANANADLIRVRGGVGSVDLDFGGTWTRDLEVSTRLAIGGLTLRVPDDVGLRLEVKRVAAGLDHGGLVKRDDGWYSSNWDTAPHKVHVRAETVFGQIELKPSTR